MRAAAMLCLMALPAAADVTAARLVQPTDRYDHAVLGDALEWGGLRITVAGQADLLITLPESRVFEDIETRIADLDGDGAAEVIVVETDMARGATLAVYDASGKRAATEPVGRTHRWLAPAGIGDFDGDGRVEIAYVDRPHLARELVFLRYDRGTLTEVARISGLTNHRIGQDTISGGSVVCDGQDTLIVASADWSRRVAVRLKGGAVSTQDAGPLRGAGAWTPSCP